jgi:phosphotransferase family enzyme
MSELSALEPLLPRGEAERALVLGSEPHASLVPPGANSADRDVDIVLLLPARHELREPSWMRAAARRASVAIRQDGAVYALVPRGHRRRARAALAQAGLLVETPYAHLPNTESLRYLVPLERRLLQYIFERAIPTRPRIRAALRPLLSLPYTEKLLAATLPAVGLIARRVDGRPLADWVGRATGSGLRAQGAIVGTSWRGPTGSITMHCFGPGAETPWGIAKLATAGGDEGPALVRLGPAAARAGARVAEPLGRVQMNARSVVIETHVTGTPAASLLARSPHRLHSLLESLTAWLARWAEATASRTTVDRAFLDDFVVRPAASLRDLLPDGYAEWLRARCDALVGAEAPLVATHNDLTMWNVLLDDRNSLGVVDWETAEDRGLPLVDFFYAVTDAAAAGNRYASRLGALRSCFVRGGEHTEFVAGLQDRVAAAVGMERPLAELAFHGCWIRHAANERSAKLGRSEFARIAHWLAGNTDQVLR